MKRALILTALLAMGLLMASSFAAAQDPPAATSGGQVTLSLLDRSNVSSAKFQEYREIPNGVSLPSLNLFSTGKAFSFDLQAQNVARSDQRYTGWTDFNFFGVSFDYNQTPHRMGNNGHVILQETAPGVWSMSPTLRQAINSTIDAKFPFSGTTNARTHDFYTSVLAPTFAAAGLVDLNGLRQRGNVEFDLGKKLPFDLTFSYMRELKSGSRGAGGGDILSGPISFVVEVPEPLNEIVQDYGLRAGYNFKRGNVHFSLNRNLYNNRAETTLVDNPYRPFDLAYSAAVGTTTPSYGGPGTARFIGPPDNEATTSKVGFMLKFPRQTRVSGDVSLATWTQNAAFYPYGNNSTAFTTAGAPVNVVSSLQQPSLNGKINTTTMYLSFVSRPMPGLGVRMRYRTYDLSNKTVKYVVTGDMSGGNSGGPDRNWGIPSAANYAEFEFGRATMSTYDTTTKRFDALASYDIKDLTFEAALHRTNLTRTNREATSGTDNGWGVSAVYHASEWLGLRAFTDKTMRTAEGTPNATNTASWQVYGYQADEAEREMTRTGFDVELTPVPSLGVTLAYFRRNVDYTGRPLRDAANSDSTVGLLSQKYDSYTLEFEFTPSERVELGAFYTHEKDASTNRWASGSTTLTNLVRWDASDKTNTFGANAVIQFVPKVWTFSLMAQQQKVDGLMDITPQLATATMVTGRATLTPPGVADIPDWDDTTITSFMLQLDRAIGKAWQLGVGYYYEKYDFSDAYTSGTALMPIQPLIFMKADNGNYQASVGYAKLTYRF